MTSRKKAKDLKARRRKIDSRLKKGKVRMKTTVKSKRVDQSKTKSSKSPVI